MVNETVGAREDLGRSVDHALQDAERRRASNVAEVEAAHILHLALSGARRKASATP